MAIKNQPNNRQVTTTINRESPATANRKCWRYNHSWKREGRYTGGSGAAEGEGAAANRWPHKLHNRAEGKFSYPHLGQRCC